MRWITVLFEKVSLSRFMLIEVKTGNTLRIWRLIKLIVPYSHE